MPARVRGGGASTWRKKAWSLSKYVRFVRCFGGWERLQELLRVLRAVADKHTTTIAAVATRWVLAHPACGAVIIGARLGASAHTAEHARGFGVELDAEDAARIDAVLSRSSPIPGDCGDEYRRPPFLTARRATARRPRSFADAEPC